MVMTLTVESQRMNSHEVLAMSGRICCDGFDVEFFSGCACEPCLFGRAVTGENEGQLKISVHSFSEESADKTLYIQLHSRHESCIVTQSSTRFVVRYTGQCLFE